MLQLPRPHGLPRRIPAWAWKRIHRPAHKPQAGPHKLPAWFWTWRAWRLHVRPGPKPVILAMFDDVNLTVIPKYAKAVAGYVGGQWPTYAKIRLLWPNAKRLSVAVAASFDADVLDVEKGDAIPDQAPAWIRKQAKLRAAGSKSNTPLPVVYTSLAFAQSLVNLLDAHGLRYGKDYMLWCAHYDFKPHICSAKRCGLGLKVTAHATQYTDKALGHSLDESLCRPGFFK